MSLLIVFLTWFLTATLTPWTKPPTTNRSAFPTPSQTTGNDISPECFEVYITKCRFSKCNVSFVHSFHIQTARRYFIEDLRETAIKVQFKNVPFRWKTGSPLMRFETHFLTRNITILPWTNQRTIRRPLFTILLLLHWQLGDCISFSSLFFLSFSRRDGGTRAQPTMSVT